MPEPDAAIRNRRRIGLTELVLVNLHKSFSQPHGGADGLAEASETAVLNANYLKARLAEGRAGERVPVAFDRHCMHEFVLSGKPMTKESLDAFADAIEQILAEAESDPEKAKQAPLHNPRPPPRRGQGHPHPRSPPAAHSTRVTSGVRT